MAVFYEKPDMEILTIVGYNVITASGGEEESGPGLVTKDEQGFVEQKPW